MGSEGTLIAALVGAGLLGLVIQLLSFVAIKRTLPPTGATAAKALMRHARWPLRALIPVTAVDISLAFVRANTTLIGDLAHGLGVLIIVAAAWLVIALTSVLEEVVLSRFSIDQADNLRARQIHTQVQVLRRVLVVVIAIVAIAMILVSFSAIRAYGASLLASAGLAGLVAGLAARPAITNMLSGLQIAITQPIRVDDVVVVEGQWSRVEEITFTYVVVRIWDLRRLILPISYFTSTPFENWTRRSADILGTVYLEVDYTAPIEAIRQKLHEVLAGSPLWDGLLWRLQVTNAQGETMTLRALMSARDSSASWDLRCLVREELVAFLAKEHPGALPRVRLEREPRPAPSALVEPGTDPDPNPAG